jgi:hypothetical protein
MNLRSLLATAAILMAANSNGRAATLVYSVTLNTTSLAGSASGPFVLDAQLNDGGDPANNTAVLSNFVFGGGAVFGPPTLTGGALGSLGGGITITDSDFLNEFRQSFQAGSLLSFTLSLTTNPDPSGTPDEFSLAILDHNGVELPTESAAIFGTSVILLADLTGGQTQLLAFGSAPGAPLTFAAPVATPPSSDGIPEPATWTLIIGGLMAGACLRLAPRSSD